GNAATTESPGLSLIAGRPAGVPATSATVNRFMTPCAVTSSNGGGSSPPSGGSVTSVRTTSPLSSANSSPIGVPRVRPLTSAADSAVVGNTRPLLVSAQSLAWVVVPTRCTSTSWRPKVTLRGPSTGSRPTTPDCDTATTHGSS